MKTAQPPLIACAPRRDALARPLRFPLDQAVEFARGYLLLGGDLLRPCVELCEAPVETADRAPVEPQAAGGETAQKGPVMTDQNEGAPEAREPLLKPFDGGEVEMIGRFVEKKNVRLLRQHTGKRGLARLAARQRCRIGAARKTEFIERRFGLVYGRAAGRRIIEDAGRAAKIGHLFEIGDACAGLAEDLAAIRLGETGGNAQQRRLAAAIASDEAQAVAGGQRETGARDQHLIGEGDTDVLKGEKRCGQYPCVRLRLSGG